MSEQPTREHPRTLWRLLDEYHVKIPLIQRDYAQGRQSRKIDQLRYDFLSAIAAALDPKTTDPLDLGLIYGTEKADADAPDSPVEVGAAHAVAGARLPDLLLLDGQQRLTTLFLVHWYLAWRGADLTQRIEALRRLGHFTYETRTSAREFCRVLPVEGFSLKVDKPSEGIKDASWFLSSWSKDPTINAMLVMLDDIHDKYTKFGEKDCASWWTRLSSDDSAPAIFFQFLPMSDHGLTDDLYLKMNARGRPLTEFERFKAWLERHVEKSDKFTPANRDDLGAEWKMEIDKEWADFFWQRSGGESAKNDELFLRFFKAVAWNSLLATAGTSENLALAEAVTNDSFMPTDLLVPLFTPDALRDLFTVLRCLVNGGFERIGQSELFKEFAAPKPTYKTRLVFHALCRFLVKHKPTPGERVDAIRRWVRVIDHLATHPPMAGEEFARALATVERIAPDASGDICGWLTIGEPTLRGFSGYQIREERRKAGLIQSENGKEWEAALVETEDHSFFDGQITFLLDLSREGEHGVENFDQFRQYAELARKIFARNGGLLDHPDRLVHRALLTKGDYLFSFKSNIRLFDELSARWRTDVFQKPERVVIVNALLRDLLPRVQQGLGEEAALREIIAESIALPWENNPAKDWRKLAARCPTAISFCQQNKVRFVDGLDGRYIVLLMNRQKYSANAEYAELRMYCFYEDFLKPAAASFAPFVLDDDYHTKGGNPVVESPVLPYPRLTGLGFQINIQYMVHGTDPAWLYRIELTATDGRSFAPDVVASSLSMRGQHDPAVAAAGIARFYYAEEAVVLDELLKLVDAVRALSLVFNASTAPVNLHV